MGHFTGLLRERTNKELTETMARFGESFADIHRSAIGPRDDPQAIQAAVWTGHRVYAFYEEGGCISLPLYPQDSLIEVAVTD